MSNNTPPLQVPCQSLASMNHNFLLTERRRHYLRYNGGLTFFEVRSPNQFHILRLKCT